MQLRIEDYNKLNEYVGVFMDGALDILIVEGSAGAGKSSIVRNAFADKGANEYCWLEGRTTAAALYERLYQNRDLPIIIDDVDGLYKDKEAINLLKCLCQTWEEKTVVWNTLAKKKSGTPSEFKTRSKLLVITNSWRNLNKHVGAVQDRGLLILFNPPGKEVHRYVKDTLGHREDIFDEEVYNFIGANLNIVKEPSVRHYRNALQLKRAGCDWREVLIESFGLTEAEMSVLKLNKEKLSHNERAQLFAEELKKSPRTYWRTLRDLRSSGIEFDPE